LVTVSHVPMESVSLLILDIWGEAVETGETVDIREVQ